MADPVSTAASGSYKGIMLCERPADNARNAGAPSKDSNGIRPFVSSSSCMLNDELGVSPRKVKDGQHVDSRAKAPNPALVKHRKWLNEQAKESEEKKAKAEEEAKKESERSAKFQEAMQGIRRDIIEGKSSPAVSSWAASTVKSGLVPARSDTTGLPKAELDQINNDLESLVSGALLQAGVAPATATPPSTAAATPPKPSLRLPIPSATTGSPSSAAGQDMEAELRSLVDDALQLSARCHPPGGNQGGGEAVAASSNAPSATWSSPNKGRDAAGRPAPAPRGLSASKCKQKPKPKWALSESQAEEDDMMDAEADDLLKFAEELDFDRYENMSEAQLRSALESMLEEVVGPTPGGKGSAAAAAMVADDSSNAGASAAGTEGKGAAAAAGGQHKRISQSTMENRIAVALQSGDEAWKSRFVSVMNQLAMKEATKSKARAAAAADDDRRSMTSAATSMLSTGSTHWQVAEILRKENLNLRNIHSAASIRAMLEKQAEASC